MSTAESLLRGVLDGAPDAPAFRARDEARPAAPAPPPLERLIGDNPWRWVPLAGMWLAFGFLAAFSIHVSAIAAGLEGGVGRILFATIPDVAAWALLCPMIYRALFDLVQGARRAAAAARLAAWSALAIVTATVASYLGAALRDGVEPSFRRFVELYVSPPVGPTYQAMSLSVLLITLAAFGVLLAQRQRTRAQWDMMQARLRDAELERRVVESRLQALQSRINPHFLLNTLNGIAGFVQSGQPDRAFDTLARLGTLLQSALRQGERRDIPLAEEFEFAERYAELLAMRHGDRVRCVFHLPEGLRARRVPALVVQPLIENAVRHGLRAGQPLAVAVRARHEGRAVVVEVQDDGRGLVAGAPAALPAGHGLANVAERLRLVFGEEASLVLEPAPGGGARVRLRFPG